MDLHYLLHSDLSVDLTADVVGKSLLRERLKLQGINYIISIIFFVSLDLYRRDDGSD